MIANIASANVPMIATRSASFGVSGGRLSSGVWIISNGEGDQCGSGAG